MTDFCCVLASLDLFSSYHEIPALLCCFWSVSDLLWRPHSLQSFYFLGITSPCSASHYHCPASRAVGLFWASWWCKLLSLVLFVSSRTCQFLIGHPSHPTREVYLSAAFSVLLLSKHLFSFLHQAFLLAYTTIWFLLRCSEVPLLFSQFLHNSALWLSYKFLLQVPVLLCYKRKTYWGLKKAQQESDTNLLLLWEKKYVLSVCAFPVCMPDFIFSVYQLHSEPTYKFPVAEAVSFFCGKAWSWEMLNQQQKVFDSKSLLFSCPVISGESYGFVASLCIVKWNLILFIHVAKNGFEKQWWVPPSTWYLAVYG